MSNSRKIPDVVIRRLPVYLRTLNSLDVTERPIVSSEDIAGMIGSSSGQVRKDFSYFGVFGKQGVGYQVGFLKEELKRILKLNREMKIGLIGAGNLGAALVRYHQKNQAHRPLEIVAVFDVDPQKIGHKLAEVEVFDIKDLSSQIKALDIKMMILAFPADGVQQVVDQCVESGVKAFLNFVPAPLRVPPGIKVQNSDVTLDLESLVYYT